MTNSGERSRRITRAARRLLVTTSLSASIGAPLGAALAHERLKPTFDEATRASGALFETLSASVPGARQLSLNGSRFALTALKSALPPRAAVDEAARACSQRSVSGIGVALGTNRGAAGACITLSREFWPSMQVTFARPSERGAVLLSVGSLDPSTLTSLLSTNGAGQHLPYLPRPVGRLTLGAALDGTPLLAMYAAPRPQLDEMQARLAARGARTRRGGKEALYVELAGHQHLLVETTTRGETRLVVLRLPY